MFLVSHTECKHSVFDIVTMISMLLLCPRGDRLLSVCTHCSSSPAFPSIIPSSFLLCGWCICTVLSRVLLKSAWQQHSSPSHGLMPFCSELNMVTNLPFKHFQCTVISLNCICLTAHFLFSAHYLWSQQSSKISCCIPDLFLIAYNSQYSVIALLWNRWYCTIIMSVKPRVLWNMFDTSLNFLIFSTNTVWSWCLCIFLQS